MSPPDSPEGPTPASQPFLIGHDKAESALAAAHAGGRLAHAWLFTGPEGVGKASLAFRFARHLLSGLPAEEGRFAAAANDPDSRVFRLVAAGAHPDLLVVARPEEASAPGKKPPQDVPVEQIRRIPTFLSLAAEGAWRVVVVDEADRLTRSAANALLKALEEPPACTVLILTSVTPGRLLPTIRSRCRRLDLETLSEADLGAWLDRSGLTVPEADRDLLIALAGGAPGRLARLVEQDGAAVWRALQGLLAAAPKLDWGAAHKLSDRLSRPAADAAYELSADLLCRWLEDRIRRGARGQGGPPVQLDRLVKVWEKAQDLFAAAKGANLDKRTTLLQIFAALEDAAQPR